MQLCYAAPCMHQRATSERTRFYRIEDEEKRRLDADLEEEIQSDEYPADISLVGTNGILVDFVEEFPMEGEVTATGFWAEHTEAEAWSSSSGDPEDTADEGMEAGSMELFIRQKHACPDWR